MGYRRPKSIFERKVDEPGQELYLVSIQDDETVLSAYGRYAHGSGGKTVSWDEFLQGEMNGLVERTMGKEVLNEVLTKLRESHNNTP